MNIYILLKVKHISPLLPWVLDILLGGQDTAPPGAVAGGTQMLGTTSAERHQSSITSRASPLLGGGGGLWSEVSSLEPNP